MLGVDHLSQLVDAMRTNGITTLEVKGADYSVRLVRSTAEMVAPVSVRRRVTSPAAGKFAARGKDDGLPPLSRGTSVAASEILGYLCLGPVRVPLEAPCSGTILGVLPKDGVDVEEAEDLFTLETRA